MDMRQVFIDTETTGVSHAKGDRIIEIAAVEAVNGVLTGECFHEYLNPERQISFGAQQVHGITDGKLVGKPKFSSISSRFIEFVRDAEIIMHNATFDSNFIDSELARCGTGFSLASIGKITCSLGMARQAFPGKRNDLDALMQRAGLDCVRGKHSALEDAKLLASVYFTLLAGGDRDLDASSQMVASKKKTILAGRPSIDLPNLIHHLAPIAERYLTLLRVHPSKRYNYAKRHLYDLPVIEVEQHGHKCKIGESWLYFAVPASAQLESLAPQDRLYVGAQTQDRMFRGDGLDGNNYHHAEMRAGNGDDTLVAFLATGQKIAVYRVPSQRVATAVSTSPALRDLRKLVEQPRTAKKHLGWWFEQYVLCSEPSQWRWNTTPAARDVVRLFS